MPYTRIETRRGWIGERRQDVIEAVQRALCTGLLIPETDRCVFLTEYDADALIAPPGRGPSYMVIAVTLFSGRSLEAKRRLYRALVDELAPFGVPATDVKTVLVEAPREDWGFRGLPGSEVELGFKVEV
ncbi:tautomerase-like protein [Stella humosa]|uniref:Tautomerase-like protein n=1 Tax=Stella humosa TaxID=94 RepID=A0A3N1MB02_9PROT|nr:tautomerase family protein [Stella humosa]ROQ00235.1 tautomerase-like protein [Stella humosa]BBK30529.1 hypothetical protein STHU_11630 [Stella humosa]